MSLAQKESKIAKRNVLIISTTDVTAHDIADLFTTEELRSAVHEANGNATAFVYTATDILHLARRAERRLNAMDLPQRDRVGFEAQFSHAGPSAKAYKYSARGSSVTMRRTAKGWVLSSIDQITVFPAQSERVVYRATERQIAETARRAVADLQQIAA